MKQSPTETSSKKLKQARLPFQILKNPAETTPQRKRKASETPSDGEVIVNGFADVKENHATPVEKKIKVGDDNTHKEVSSVKNNESGIADEKFMEVDDNNTEKKVVSKTTPKGKSNKASTLSSGKKKKTTRGRKAKTNEKTDDKNGGRKTKKNTESPKPNVVAIVDLCDSPCKLDVKNKTASSTSEDEEATSTSAPELNAKEKKDQEDEVIEPEAKRKRKENNTNSKEVVQKAIATGEEKELKSGDKNKKNISEVPKDATMQAKDLNKNDTKIVEEQKGDTKTSTSPENTGVCRMDNEDESDKKCTKDKSGIKQATLKCTVTKKSSEPDSINIDDNTKEDDKTDLKEGDVTPPNIEEKSTFRMNQNQTPKRNCSEPSINDSAFVSPSSADVSQSSESSTPASSIGTPFSSVETPSSTKKSFKSPLTTPRRMTPKQLLKLKEKEEKMKERERLKQEKERKKAEEKEEKLKQKLEKEKLKQEKEEEKIKLKQEKEEEKRKEKEEKEKKRQAELEQKNEEKRLKEEEKRLKEEERKTKEEEKRKKEEEEKKKKEEKRLKEEQKEAEKRKAAQAFVSFFVKSETKTSAVEDNKENTPDESNFQPFEVKNDMRLAPLLRAELTKGRKEYLDTLINSATSTPKKRLYLEEVRSPSYTRGSAVRTWPPPDLTDDDVIFIESEKPNEEMDVDNAETEQKSEKKHHRAKYLEFCENRRPPYWGTWRKKSKLIRPRAPLNQDKTIFEYDIDSDDEWEEPENVSDAESLRGTDDEESQDEQYEEDDMFVPHGYLSDEEGQDEIQDVSPEAMKAKLKFLQLEFEAERSEKQEKLKPRLIGCVWFCNSESKPSIVGSHIAELFLERRAVWEGSLPVVISPVSSSPNPAEGRKSEGTKRKLVPESMIPEIIKKVHGSRKKLSRMMNDLLEHKEPGRRPSKKCLANKIREIALWTNSTEMGFHCWFVKDDIRQAHDLMDINIRPPTPSPPTNPSTNITKFTKVLTSDERLKLLREVPTGGSTPKASSEVKTASKSTTSSAKQSVPSSSKTPSIKLTTAGTPAAKKRISLISVAPGQVFPKQRPGPLMNFVQTKSKSTKLSEENKTEETPAAVKTEEKLKKRITPITLTTAVSKPASEEECIVLSD